jgi:hypothetical protein
MVTSDGPTLDLSVLARKPGESPAITLDPYTVELLCGGSCRWCAELRAENAELKTKLRFLGVEGF